MFMPCPFNKRSSVQRLDCALIRHQLCGSERSQALHCKSSARNQTAAMRSQSDNSLRPSSTESHPVRALFISDVHLGSPLTQSGRLIELLEHVSPAQIYLVGDIFDLEWMQRRRMCFGPEAQLVLRLLHQKLKAGTEIIYIPGNHDALMRPFIGQYLSGVKFRRRAIHVTAQGRRLLVTHGDEFDTAIRKHGWLEQFGAWWYDICLALAHRFPGPAGPRTGGVRWLKESLPAIKKYTERFELAVIRDAKRRGLDGAICGHLHVPALKQLEGLTYANDGDWVENCSALLELPCGTLRLWHYTELHPRAVAALSVEVAVQSPASW
jgi:UDP-2,3-diacylglucosamine pyrophosphatase LpxH